MYTCPVCFYSELDFNPLKKDYDICPSCGTEFGLDDFDESYLELREKWVKWGCRWWKKADEAETQ